MAFQLVKGGLSASMRQPSAARAAAVQLQLPPYPLHNHVYGVTLLAVRKPASARYSVPLLKTSAAAARRGVLRYEHRMAAHGRLPAVVRRTGRGEAAAYEACRMAAYHVASLPYGIGHAVSVKPETAPERRAREPVEQRVEVVARRRLPHSAAVLGVVGKEFALYGHVVSFHIVGLYACTASPAGMKQRTGHSGKAGRRPLQP